MNPCPLRLALGLVLLTGGLAAAARSTRPPGPLATTDLAPVALLAPGPGPCYSAAEAVVVRVQNAGTNPLNFGANPATVTVNVTGAVVQTLNRTVTTGTLGPGAMMNITLTGTLNMTMPGAYSFAVTASVAGDLNPANNNLLPAPTRTAAGVTTWTGNASNNWSDPANWSACPPGLGINVVIPAGRPRYPVLAGGNVGAKNLTLAAGATLTLNADTLELKGSFVNNGNFQHGGGLVHMTGPGTQQLGGSSVTTFHHLTIGMNDVALTGPVEMRQMLTLAAAGDLLLGGHPLTLLSDHISTGMVVNVGTGVVVGNTAHARRHLSPNAQGLGYRHFSPPVSDATVTSFHAQGFTPVVNPAYNTSPNPLGVTPYPNVFGFDESRFPADSDFIKGYFSPASLTEPLVVGRGYSVYMAGTVGIEFEGTLNTGDVSQSLTQTGGFLGPTQKSGWHLLGNPYPGPIKWDSVTFPAGMSHATSVYASSGQNNGMYRTRVNGVGPLHGGDDQIPMCQGFFVRTLTTITARPPQPAAGGFTLTNTTRTTTYSNPPTRRPRQETRPMIGLALRSTGATRDEADQAWIYFQTGATAGVDLAYDGEKPQHNVGLPTLVSLTATADELAVNGLPETALPGGTTIPLLVDLPVGGTYTLEVVDLRNLAATSVVLADHLTGTRYDLAVQPAVTFRVLTAGENRTRFALEVGQRVTGLAADAEGVALALYPNPAREVVQVRVSRPAATVQLLDATGRVLKAQETLNGTATLSLAGLPAGLYAVRADGVTRHLVVE